MNWETLLSFGDSITFGARSYLGYPEYVGAILNENTTAKWNIVNHAISGYTAIDLHRDISQHFQNLQSHHPQLISLLIGTNDIKLGTEAGLFKVAYEQLIIKAKLIAKHNNIILIHIPDLQRNIRYPYRIDMNGEIARFNDIIEALSEKYQLQTFRFDFQEKDFFDGVHLNEMGSKKAAEQLAECILKDKGLESITNHT